MRVLQTRGPVLGAALIVALASIACGTGTTASTSPSPSQAAPSTAVGLPPELADAVQQPDGTYKTADGRVFSAPDQFFNEECADARWPVAGGHRRPRRAPPACRSTRWSGSVTMCTRIVGVFVDGEAEVVPAGIGIDNDGHRIAGLHTHDCTGTVHLEAEAPDRADARAVRRFVGRQARRGVLRRPLRATDPVAVQVNGEPVADPRAVVIADCDVITIVVGDPPAEIPPAAAEGC